MKRCKCCKKDLDESAFPTVPAGYRVSICWECVKRNMAKWEASVRAGRFDYRKGYNPAEHVTPEVNQ